MILPTQEECTIAVRCCPVYFELRKDGPVSVITLPYRMVFAVATQASVLFYDTQQTWPIAMVSNIHYGRLNDISWYVNYHINPGLQFCFKSIILDLTYISSKFLFV